MFWLWGAIPAALYLFVAIPIAIADRRPGSGHFINLSGLVTALVAFPVFGVMELIHHKLDARNIRHVTLALAICAALVAVLGLAIGWLASSVA